jgi:predicted nucleotidyltransferase
MLPHILQIATEFKDQLQKIYGNELSHLILFGSYARGDYHIDSDIDFAVVLNNSNTNSTSEIDKISVISHDFGLKHNIFVSYIGMSESKLKNSQLGFYQEIRREGITI